MEEARIKLQSVGSGPEFCLTTRRNCSVSPQALLWLLAITAGLSFAIGIGFAMFGAWPVLPFAGLEVAALGLAFYANGRHASDYERIALRKDALVVEVRDADRVAALQLNPQWVKLVASRRRQDVRLALRSHGREIEIGRHLDAPGREALARELAGRLDRTGHVN
jgi:uncharacterized membrane protein